MPKLTWFYWIKEFQGAWPFYDTGALDTQAVAGDRGKPTAPWPGAQALELGRAAHCAGTLKLWGASLQALQLPRVRAPKLDSAQAIIYRNL